MTTTYDPSEPAYREEADLRGEMNRVFAIAPSTTRRPRGVASKLKRDIEKAGNDVVAGDCSLANGGIVQETGQIPVHPLSFVARAYGIPVDEPS